MSSRRSGLLSALHLLVVFCAVGRSRAFHYEVESLSDVDKSFSAARMDVAILLPLELRLHMRIFNWSNYSEPLNMIMGMLKQRQAFVQRSFHKTLAPRGFMLSESRRIRVEKSSLIMYYYVAYIGPSNLATFKNNIKRTCTEAAETGLSGIASVVNCSKLESPQVALLYNLLLLSSFRFFPQDVNYLKDIFTDFKPIKNNFVTAHNSEAHDVTSLLCKVFLRCDPTLCNVSKIFVPKSVKAWPEWALMNSHMSLDSTMFDEGDVTISIQELVKGLYADLILDTGYKDSQEDFGVYRSWCMKSASSVGPGCLMVATASALLLFALPLTIYATNP